MKRVLLIIFAVLFLAATTGNSHADEKDVVAKIGSRVITNAEFNEYLKAFPKNDKVDMSQLSVKKDILKAVVNTIVVADKARAKGIDKTKEVEKIIEMSVNNILVAALVNSEIVKKIEVAEDDIKLYYSTKKDEFKSPEMVSARHILIRANIDTPEADLKTLKEKAEGILKRAKAGEDFAKLAAEFSDDASKTKGGDLGYFPRGKAVQPFEDAAFAMKPGDVSDLVQTKFGYHIIKLEGRKEAEFKPLEEVRNKIKQNILESRISAQTAEYLYQALKDAMAELFPEKLDAGK
jgi:parvulin-like peptidyl-prolyl isomerase